MKKGKRVLCLCMAAVMAASMAGCGDSETGSGTETTEAEVREPFVPEVVGTYEAEEATLNGNVKVAGEYVEGFEQDDDTCTFHISIEETGFYDLNFVSAGLGGAKDNNVSVDGEVIGTVHTAGTEFGDAILNRVYMEAGEHEVALSKSWGWIQLDCLQVLTAEPIDASLYNVTAALANPNADEATQRLYSYLLDIYGEKFLSGQFCDTGQYGKEFQVIKSETGKTPAIIGLDFIEYTPSRVENGSSSNATDLAIDFWNDGGIVSFCWHWNAPSKYLTGQWYSGFYKEYTNIDLAKIMGGEDEEGYELLLEDIAAIAEQLKILQDAGVPVLWRPLHEASGGWFWWGTAGADAYKELYILLYDKLTNEYGLNNLIWVWNGQDAEWYPGDEYVDIIGEDIYPGEQVYTSQAASFLNAATNYSTERKMVYLTENGCLFDPDLARRDGAMWGMWCTWQGEFVAKDIAIFTLSEQYTDAEMLKKVYEDEDVITRDKLPDLTTYEIRSDLE